MTLSSLDRLMPDYIRRFEAYIPSKPDEELKKLYRCERLYRLNNNENVLGPPAAARKIIDRFPPPKASIYPSGDVYYLRHQLARQYGLDPDQFLVGNGANEVIGFRVAAPASKVADAMRQLKKRLISALNQCRPAPEALSEHISTHWVRDKGVHRYTGKFDWQVD